METKYHKGCSVSFRARGRSDERQSSNKSMTDVKSSYMVHFGQSLLNSVHYARWVPAICKSINEFKEHLNIYHELLKVHVVTKKSERPFSAFSDDPAHEQNKLKQK
ncbi:hypothetical protein AVEN_185559-1 [Araneus ventricosus]|uniref:Uncharacterized protein n=1 Tax=Araneus ventricosus TaxID=182803 RepID=A0A4Y2HD31_ARAVE|nr:hypothetical protein AVEN_185559-1 [Araneus ventricosus]